MIRGGGGGGTKAERRDSNAARTRTRKATLQWQVRGRAIELDRPLIAGILNVTPDSFSDGGLHYSRDAALEHAARMLEEGADIIDIGGESTRPQGAVSVPVKEELERVVPIVKELSQRFPSSLLSVDTVKARVAEAALDAGAHIVNDVSAFRLDPRMAGVCGAGGAGVVLMHSRGDVRDMATYQNASYGEDPAGDVLGELLAAVERAVRGGVNAGAIALDPGIGFSKLSSHSIAVLRDLALFGELGYPLMVGVSRKRFIGELSGVPDPAARVFGSIAANVIALVNGAMIFRVHDVLATRQALDVAWGILTQGDN